MNDTSPEMEAKVRELFMRRSGQERLRMGCEMFSMTRAIMTASLKAQGYSGMELKKQIFLRTYGQDFTSDVLNEICQTLFSIEHRKPAASAIESDS